MHFASCCSTTCLTLSQIGLSIDTSILFLTLWFHYQSVGEDNEKRLTGKHETASINEFSYGVANRGCSVRIGRVTAAEGFGYFEDRRPASNVDPYLATGKIMMTVMEDIIAPAAERKDKAAA